jgi:hypothetical protein
MGDLVAIKAASKAKEISDRAEQERRRNTLVVVLRHLLDNGYVESYERLLSEANLSLAKVL